MSEEKAISCIAPGAVVLGNVEIGEGVSIWYNAVIRADDEKVHIGNFTNIQDNCTLHVNPGGEVYLGDYVTVGHNAIVHGCRVGDNSLIGMGAIVMNHAVIGKNCIVAAGALVTEHTVIPDNSLVMGSPAKIRRQLTEEEIVRNRWSAELYTKEGKQYAEKYGWEIVH